MSTHLAPLSYRKVFCTVLMAAALCGCARFSRAPEPARLVGTLWWVTEPDAHRPVTKWRKDLDELEALGMDLLVLNGPFVAERLAEHTPDPMCALFEELDRRGMRVYLDTLAAPQWWTLDDPAAEVARASARLAELEARYGRFACFEGFYIPYETYACWGESAELVRTLYAEVSACCKRVSPERKVMISPFFILDEQGILGDFRWATPEEYEAFWTETLTGTGIDIVALQDSGEHLSYYEMDDRLPFFRAMKSACEAANVDLWANVETGELHVRGPKEYVERFGEKTHVNDPKTAPHWRGVPADKLLRKLRLAGRFTDTAITWGYREYVRPSRSPAAAELYLDYYLALKSAEKGERR